MTEFSIFYKILGIAEDIIEPSYYHLLGIERSGCSAATVAGALKKCKNELRQNVPGPQFIPMVLKFEQEQLALAAEVLGDDKKRHAYDRQLAKKWKKMQAETQKRGRQISAVRAAIVEAVSGSGSLDEAGRAILAENLRRLGVDEGNISLILKKIPVSIAESKEAVTDYIEFFAGAVRLAIAEGAISDEEKAKLFELAARLRIGTRTAVKMMQEAVTLTGKAGGGTSGQADKILLVKDVLADDTYAEPPTKVAAPDAAVRVKKDTEVEEVYPPDARFDWASLVNIMLPIAVITIFTMIVLLTGKKNARPDEEEDPAPAASTSDVENSAIESLSAGEMDQMLTGVGDKSPDEQVGKIETSADKTTMLQIKVNQSTAVESLHRRWDISNGSEQILADAAFAMMACCDRAGRFLGSKSRFGEELKRLMSLNDWAEAFALRTVQTQVDSPVSETGRLSDKKRLAELKARLNSSSKFERYGAIDELANDGSHAALMILIGESEGELIGTKQMINRRLRAVKETNNPVFARELAYRMGLCRRPFVAHQIYLMLIDLTAIKPIGNGVLAARNELSDRQQCSMWWRDTLGGWKGRKYPASKKQLLSNKQIRLLKLTAVAGYYMEALSDDLSIYNRRDDPGIGISVLAGDVKIGFSGADAGVKLDESAAKMADELARIVRTHPSRGQWLVRTDIISLERKVRLLACETLFQRTAVNLDTSGRYLQVLVKETFGQGADDVLAQIKVEYDEKERTVSDVLQEIRFHCYFNLRLWDILLEKPNTIVSDGA